MEENLIKTYVAAGAVIKQGGKYLLIQEKKPSAQGLWCFPSGRVRVGNSIEETAIRETKEETGYDIELIRKIDIFQESAEHFPKHAFEAKIIGGELKYPKDEILDVRWFNFEEIKKLGEQNKLRKSWILGAINILEK